MKSNQYNLKQKILDKITEFDIFNKYTDFEIKLGKSIKSPLREKEKHPSFNIYKSNSGNILFKDFAGESGDCFYFVMLKFNTDFNEALKIIAQDFNISYSGSIPKRNTNINISVPKIELKQEKIFIYEEKMFTPDEIKYWTEYGITLDILKEYNVISVNKVKEQSWSYEIRSNHDNPIFAYKYNSGHIRFYRPMSKQLKHFGNSNKEDIFGSNQIKDKQDHICICAGQKDVMSLYSNSGIRGVCLNSESSHLDSSLYIHLKSICCELSVIYDNDDTGKRYTLKMCEEYPGIRYINPLYFSILKCKDVSDYYKYLIKNNIKEKDLEQIIKR